MIGRHSHRNRGTALAIVIGSLSFVLPSPAAEVIRHKLEFKGSTREYYVQVPENYDSGKSYWALVAVHGGGGNGRRGFLAEGFRTAVKSSNFNAIVVSPSFSNKDFQSSRFPALGEGVFLKTVIEDLKSRYSLNKKILLSGYSRGGQFSHRFAFANPDLVKAVAPCAAGTWTTPDGQLLIESLGAIPDPSTYLNDANNAAAVPERLHGMFTERVATVAGIKPLPGASKIPFLIMCGSLDTRFEISQQFAQSMKDAGFSVRTSWPRTPHSSKDKSEFIEEFEKYSTQSLEFFVDYVQSSKP